MSMILTDAMGVLAQSAPVEKHFLIPNWSWLAFCVALGASVGSFLTVVISRLPHRLSLIRPRSRCPKCFHRLTWYDNLPILTWLMLGGQCRYCKTKIGFIYPFIEVVTATLFGLWFYVCYMTEMRPTFSGPGIAHTGIIFLPGLVLLAVLVASTFIDAEHWIIPIELPHVAALTALILMPLGVMVSQNVATGAPQGAVARVLLPPVEMGGNVLTPRERAKRVFAPYNTTAEVRVAIANGREGELKLCAAPMVSPRAAIVGVGGFIGLIIANAFLRLGIFKQSFPLEEGDVDIGGPENWTTHDNPRGEIIKEILFISPIALGMFAGFIAGPSEVSEPWSPVFLTFAGVLLGYIGGGAVVWILRILGTLGFGKEAMGMGDVHLMAGVGAVVGWPSAVVAFFVAPFFGIAYVLMTIGATILMRREMKEVPFGPHLAIATVLVMFYREPMLAYFGILFGL